MLNYILWINLYKSWRTVCNLVLKAILSINYREILIKL